MPTLELGPGSFTLEAYSNNPHDITVTFPVGYDVGVLADWDVWIALSPTGTHLYNLTPGLAGQVLSFTISAATTAALVNTTAHLYVAQDDIVLIDGTVTFADTSSGPSSSALTVELNPSAGEVSIFIPAGAQGA